MRRLRNLTAGFVPATNYISYRLDLTWINESQLQRIDPLINLLPRKSELSGRPLKSGAGLPVYIPTMPCRDQVQVGELVQGRSHFEAIWSWRRSDVAMIRLAGILGCGTGFSSVP